MLDHPAILSRKKAEALGLKCYFTGEPCKHGHIAERNVRSGACSKCNTEQCAKRRAANLEKMREKDRERARKHRAKDPEGFKKYCRRWRAANRQEIREYRRRWCAAKQAANKDRRAAQRRVTNEASMTGA